MTSECITSFIMVISSISKIFILPTFSVIALILLYMCQGICFGLSKYKVMRLEINFQQTEYYLAKT